MKVVPRELTQQEQPGACFSGFSKAFVAMAAISRCAIQLEVRDGRGSDERFGLKILDIDYFDSCHFLVDLYSSPHSPTSGRSRESTDSPRRDHGFPSDRVDPALACLVLHRSRPRNLQQYVGLSPRGDGLRPRFRTEKPAASADSGRAL